LLRKQSSNYYYSVQDFKLRKIIIQTAEGYSFIPLGSIEYIQGLESGTRFYLENGKAVVTNKEYAYFTSFLPQLGIYPIHDEYSVNSEFVVRYNPDGRFLETKTGNVVPVSLKKVKELLDRFEKERLKLELA